MSVHFSSDRMDWETPQDFFDDLNYEFNFDVDVCATEENTKCNHYFNIELNGLLRDWRDFDFSHSGRKFPVCWMNPPYGREIIKWMKKAYEESLKGYTVVCLVPSRTDTKWWHEYAMKGEIRFIRGRLKFQGAKHSAPFPSAVVIFRRIG